VVGAGIAGLMAARELKGGGHDVVVFDKGRSPGGRLATRRIGSGRFDHGAQFFTVRSDAFGEHVSRWRASGFVGEWCRGFGEVADGHPRYVASGGMSALAKHVAAGLDVRCNSLVFGIHRGAANGTWEVRLDDATVTACDALVVTSPLPQSYSLLVSGDVAIPDLLWRTDYHRTLGLLALLDRPSAVPAPGGVQGAGPLQFVADNQQKGISDVPALTVHANAEWSRAHWDDDHDTARHALIELAAPYLGDATVIESHLKRWRFATPQSIWPDPCWSPDDGASVVLAGDAFAGPKVATSNMEGAALSGLAAAARLIDL
jgi:hypothetical protein